MCIHSDKIKEEEAPQMYTTVSVDSSHKVTEHYDMQEKLGMWVSDMSNPNFPIIIFPSRNKKFVRNYNYNKLRMFWHFQFQGSVWVGIPGWNSAKKIKMLSSRGMHSSLKTPVVVFYPWQGMYGDVTVLVIGEQESDGNQPLTWTTYCDRPWWCNH